MPEVRLERRLRVPADPASEALAEMLNAIAKQEGRWRGFALHIGLSDLHLPDVGYVAVPIHLKVEKSPADIPALDVAFGSANLPDSFPRFKGTMGASPGQIGECTLFLYGAYDLPMQFFGRLLDAALTPKVAIRSLENFIDEIAAAIQARVDQREDEFARYRFYAQSMP